MTTVPSPDGARADLTDVALVARLANDLFREAPGITDAVATQAEDLDALPGQGANSAADLAASTVRIAHRTNPELARSVPPGLRADAAPGALGAAAASPSGFTLRSLPIGQPLPAEAVEPWRHLAADPWRMLEPGSRADVAFPDAPMVSVPPVLRSALDLGALPPPAGPPGIGAPGPAPGRSRSGDTGLYFLRPGAGPAPSTARPPGSGYDPGDVRRDFPVLRQQVHGRRLVWLDNAATTQKPQCVIDAVARFYERDNSNVHRGAHQLAARATDAYEGARAKVAALLGAASTQEVIFVRGTTEAINLVAQSYGRQAVGAGDEIVLTTLDHHSNIVPWQLLAKERGASLKPVRITDRGDVMLDHYASLLGPRTRIVALPHVSNALGTIVAVEAMAAMARAVGAVVVVDGAQGVPHLPVDVQALGADFYAFSGHKLYGPTGVGVLWGRQALLEAMPPWQGGGQMIKTVDFESSTWNDLPYKFEAGTGAIGPAVGLGRAVDYVTAVGLPHIAAHEQALLAHGTEALTSVPGLRLVGTSPHKAGVLSFVLEGTDPEEVGRFLDQEGIAVRAGHHCAQPALRHFGLHATVRPSIGLYNTHDDIDVLAAAVRRAAHALRRP